MEQLLTENPTMYYQEIKDKLLEYSNNQMSMKSCLSLLFVELLRVDYQVENGQGKRLSHLMPTGGKMAIWI